MSTALITGASSGIGYELAIYHASCGGNLIIVARSENKLNALKNLVTSEFQVDCHVIAMDLTTENAGKILMDEIQSQQLEVDYLINNAGVGFTQDFVKEDITTWQQMIQLNITALTDLCYYFVQQKLESGEHGKILNVASTAAFQGIPYMSVYSATKAYVLTFTEALAEEIKNTKLTVTALCPGPTRSNFGSTAGLDERISNARVLPSASSVAKFGYEKMLDGEVTVIHGLGNRIGAAAAQFAGRRTASKVAGQLFKMVKK
jgi:short-subunit dehydrogenase